MDGDFQLAANGTVTDRYGDQVLAFGHPFLGLGPVRVPMATAEVVTVLSNANSSFKISNSGRIVGAFEQDRKTGIQGRIGAEAPMIPMVLRVKSERPREYQDAARGAAGVHAAAGGQRRGRRAGGRQLHDRLPEPRHDGPPRPPRLRRPGGAPELRRQHRGAARPRSFLLAIVSYISQNPLEKVDVESVEVDLAQTDQPVFANLVGANASRTVVRPGDRVMLNLDFVPYRGDRFRHSMPLDLPEDLPAGRYSLLVGDGASVDAARLSLEPAEPVSFPQALELLRSFHSRRDLIVLGVYGGAGLSVAGEAMPRLPGSVRSLWGAAASGSAVALRSAVVQEKREAMAVPIQGLVRIDLDVRRREPVAGEDQGAGAAGNDVASKDDKGRV